MTIPYLFPTFLMLHLTALVLMAGTTLVDYLAYSSLWKSLSQGEQPEALLNMMAKLPRVIGIGAAILILSGIGMMALTHGVFGEQLWFRIKFGLVILIILNGLLVGRRQGSKLYRILAISGPIFTVEVNRIKSNLGRFHLVQMLLFLLVIFLSVFKFN
jgi:uncharacterized membrane protein SirB2